MMRSSREASGRVEGLAREPIWVESNHQKDAARSLEMLHVQLISAVIDPYSWKWVVFALHHSLHAFIVGALWTAEPWQTQEQEVSGRSLKIDLAAADASSEFASGSLSQRYAALKRRIPLAPSQEIEVDIQRLCEAYEALFQSVSGDWTLRVSALPKMTQSCLQVVEQLGWNPGYIVWRRENLTDLARVKLLASMKVLEALESQYHG